MEKDGGGFSLPPCLGLKSYRGYAISGVLNASEVAGIVCLLTVERPVGLFGIEIHTCYRGRSPMISHGWSTSKQGPKPRFGVRNPCARHLVVAWGRGVAYPRRNNVRWGTSRCRSGGRGNLHRMNALTPLPFSPPVSHMECGGISVARFKPHGRSGQPSTAHQSTIPQSGGV